MAHPIGRSTAATCRRRSPTQCKATQDIALKLGTRVEDFATHVNGITVQARDDQRVVDERGFALIGADGVWSTLRARIARRAARRRSATAPPGARWCRPNAVAEEFREPLVHLWLGLDAHLVHYPVKAGRLINIVAIVHDDWKESGWSAPGDRAEILRHFSRALPGPTARAR